MGKRTVVPWGRGDFIRGVREGLLLTQQEAADKIGVTAVTLSRWERAERCPSLRHRAALCAAYGLTPQELRNGL